jgi:hypothetical protein
MSQIIFLGWRPQWICEGASRPWSQAGAFALRGVGPVHPSVRAPQIRAGRVFFADGSRKAAVPGAKKQTSNGRSRTARLQWLAKHADPESLVLSGRNLTRPRCLRNLDPTFYFEYLIAESFESLRQKIASERCPCWIHEPAIL